MSSIDAVFALVFGRAIAAIIFGQFIILFVSPAIMTRAEVFLNVDVNQDPALFRLLACLELPVATTSSA